MKCGGKERIVAWSLLRSSTSAEQTPEAAMEAKFPLCCMLILKDACTLGHKFHEDLKLLDWFSLTRGAQFHGQCVL